MTDIPLSRQKGCHISVFKMGDIIMLNRWWGNGRSVANGSVYSLTANEAADLAAALAKASGMELRCFARLVTLGDNSASLAGFSPDPEDHEPVS